MNIVRLTDVCDFQGGTQPPKSDWIKDSKSGYIRMLQIRDFTQRERNNIEYVKEKASLKTCNESDILIGRYGASIGKICSGLNGAYNVALVKTIPDSNLLNRDFLSYVLKGDDFQNFIQNIGSRAAQAGFNKTDLEGFQFPLPSLQQQHKIASILDAADALRQNDKVLIAKYDELTKALFLDMFGDPVSNPKGWGEKSLIELCTKITDGTHKTPTYLEKGVVFLSAKNIKNFKLNCDSPKYISQEEHQLLKNRCLVEMGDVLITKSGSLGMAAKVEFDFEFSIFESLALIKYLRNQVNGDFLLYFLNTESTQQQYIGMTKGVGVKHLHLTDLRKIRVITPPIVLQNQFAERVAVIEEQRAIAQKSLEKSESLFNSLLQKAFKGELN